MIYHTEGEHTNHYTTKVSIPIITPPRWAYQSLHHQDSVIRVIFHFYIPGSILNHYKYIYFHSIIVYFHYIKSNSVPRNITFWASSFSLNKSIGVWLHNICEVCLYLELNH
jgi:hypothetical protein